MSARFKSVVRDVVVYRVLNGKGREDRISVITEAMPRVDSINNVGVTPPGDMFVLWDSGPFSELSGARRMYALNFLQQHDIGIVGMERFAHIVNDELTIKRRQTFVNVVRRNRDRSALQCEQALGKFIAKSVFTYYAPIATKLRHDSTKKNTGVRLFRSVAKHIEDAHADSI